MLAPARLATRELERRVVPKSILTILPGGVVPTPAGAYLAAVDRFGGFGYSIEELEATSPWLRATADQTLGYFFS